MKKHSLIQWFCLFLLMLPGTLRAQGNEDITKVYVLFKTHLDVGFTDLSSVVTRRYIHDFIPKALDVSERLQAEGKGERYVWTTGSWLVWKYLQTAGPAEKARLEKAIRRGDIVWNAVPYTVESESMNRDLFATTLLLSRKLDKQYGKHTIAAKMTDVPGHTRSIITPMYEAGIRFLHIGVNPASPIPAVPSFCRWRDTNGKELILVYQQDYGTDDILPDGKTAVSVNFTGDNHGPHNYESVKRIYANLRQRYPNAELVGASFNEVAAELLKEKDQLPVVTSEIGDTWIYGYGSAPIRMAKFRKLNTLYSRWLAKGQLDPNSDTALNFAVELGLIAEHTQGMDVKTHLRNWDKYDMDKFLSARSSEAFQKMERSWKEIDNYIDSALVYLPDNLQKEARAALDSINHVQLISLPEKCKSASPQPWKQSLFNGLLQVEGLTCRLFDSKDYDNYLNHYLRARYGWALDDIGKTGLDQSHAVSTTLKAEIQASQTKKTRKGTRIISDLAFKITDGADARVCPEKMQIECFLYKNNKKADITVTLFNKPAIRLPEAYWLSFRAKDILGIVAEKTGERVDLLDVVSKGNRRLHGIDRYVDMQTKAGTFRIYSEAAFLVNVGEANGLDYTEDYPDPQGGIHFNLSNNLWGTNFTMWNEGSLTYRFTVEKID